MVVMVLRTFHLVELDVIDMKQMMLAIIVHAVLIIIMIVLFHQ